VRRSTAQAKAPEREAGEGSEQAKYLCGSLSYALIVAVLALCGLAFALGAVYLMSLSLGANVGTPELRTLFATTPIAEIAGIAVSLLMLIIGLSAIAFGELIEVVLEIEANTRKPKDKVEKRWLKRSAANKRSKLGFCGDNDSSAASHISIP